MKKIGRLIGLLIFLPLLLSAHDGDSHDEPETGPPLIYGVLEFPNSGAPEAQDAFTRGVLLLHSFEFDEARTAFQEAQAADPDFIMAIWGEAMTHNFPLWANQERSAALAALDKLPPRQAWALLDNERALLEAALVLYGWGEENPVAKPQRDRAFMEALQVAHEKYPDDLEIASFYGLSILGTVYERDFRTYMRAAAVLEEVFAKQPRHPGAAHYLIHSYDDQVHAPLGLRAARVYATIAPSASHAQHMISHIYTSLGMWDEVVAANITAVEVSREAMLRAGKPAAHRSKHAMHWLQYALLQQGLFDEAQKTMEVMQQDREELNDGYQNSHYILFRGSWAADRPLEKPPLPRLDLPDMNPVLQVIDGFAEGYHLAMNGKATEAKKVLSDMLEILDGATVKTVEQGLHESETAISPDAMRVSQVMVDELNALLMYLEGDTAPAIELLTRATESENARALEYGPPYIPKPSSELLGEWLLEQGRPAEAIEQFEKALSRNTRRSLSLKGLYQAQLAAGLTGEATSTLVLLREQWRGDFAVLELSQVQEISP